MYLNYRELDADIIIIGAGLVGLSTAYHLLEKDPHIDFLILDVDKSFKKFSPWARKWLERSSKDDGTSPSIPAKRKVTFEKPKQHYQFISSRQKKIIDLLNKFGIAFGGKKSIYTTSSTSDRIIVDCGSIHIFPNKNGTFDFLNDQDKKVLRDFCQTVDELSKDTSFHKLDYKNNFKYDQINLEDFLQQSISRDGVRNFISQTFLINTGVKPEDVSLLFYLAYCNSINGIQNQFVSTKGGLFEYCIQDGSEKLSAVLRKIVGRSSIDRVSAINEISWDNSTAGIKTPQQYYFAKVIVFTLNEEDIEEIKFTPSVKRQGKRYRTQRRLKKFEIFYEEPFWSKIDLSGDVYVMNTENINGPIQFCQNVSSSENYHILTGLANETASETEILQQLSNYFSEDALNPVDYTEYDGSIFDARYPAGFSTMCYHDEILKNFGRIIWACPESCSNWYGTLASSIDVSAHAALRALLEIRPNILTLEDMELLSPHEVVIPERSVGVFGVKWHILVPGLLLAILIVLKLRKMLQGKVSPKLKE